MKRIFVSILSFIFSVNLFGASYPSAERRVNDYAGIMSKNAVEQTEELLSSLEAKTGAQIVVITVKSLNGESLENYAWNTAEKNGIGKKGKDNGALLLVALNERKVRIETGYGLEGTLTDTKCGLIIRNVIIPQFQQGNYSEGIYRAVKNMTGLLTSDETLVSKSLNDEKSTVYGPIYGFLFVFAWFILFSCIASGRRNHFLPWYIWFAAPRTRGTGFYNHTGTMHSNSFNSSGFGGFSGGGGHFGGGGASGSW